MIDKQAIFIEGIFIMVEKSYIIEKLVQLARLSLSGKTRDVQLFIKRLARDLHGESPEATDRLIAILQELPSQTSPFRNEAVSAVPVDRDSRLQLMRIENPVVLDIDPIWPESIYLTLKQVVNERKHNSDLLKAGLSATRTLLFTGKPGLGKTLAARWVAQKMDLPLLVLDLSAVMSSFLGRTGSNLRGVFDYAKGMPCVLFLDELDAIAKRRDDSTEIGELKRLVTVLLQEIDNWDDTGLLIAATNHEKLLDPAIWRRFDITIEFPIPDITETKAAVELYLNDSLPSNQMLSKILTNILHGKSYSDIEREIKKIRRQAITMETSIDSVIENWLKSNIEHLKLQDKHDLALSLINSGFSQRHVSDLTNVSRDTIRKKISTFSKKTRGIDEQ